MSAKKNTRRLRSIAEHVAYEIRMLRYTGKKLRFRLDRNSRNSTLESFLLHVRNLRDFFYPVKLKKDDVIADDFFADL